MARRALAGLMATMVLAAASAAAAETAATLCAPRAEMLDRLSAEFGERRRGRGIRRPAEIVEIWASDRTGVWMVVTTDMHGESCILAHGEGWETLQR